MPGLLNVARPVPVMLMLLSLSVAMGAAASGPSSADTVPVLRMAPTDDCLDVATDLGVGLGDKSGLPIPLPQACTGRIRPGALMTSPAGCTFNFVFSDGASRYIGTAGHCTSSIGQRVSASGVGSFGTVVYRIFGGGSGDDFALVRIDAERLNLVDAAMCTWGGPTAVASGGITPGEPILEYGWGVATQFHAATRARLHSGFSASAASTVTWNGVGSGGDSGAPVTTLDGEAIGIHTFGLTPIAGAVLEGGPHIQHILTRVRAAGFNVNVVTV